MIGIGVDLTMSSIDLPARDVAYDGPRHTQSNDINQSRRIRSEISTWHLNHPLERRHGKPKFSDCARCRFQNVNLLINLEGNFHDPTNEVLPSIGTGELEIGEAERVRQRHVYRHRSTAIR